MTVPLRSVAEMLAELGLETRVAADSLWVVVPCERRGSVPVQLVEGERSVVFRAFIMRAPDTGHQDVYQRLLRKNDVAGVWAFSLDALGDVFLVATRPASSLTAGVLDGILGSLSALVDETFEGIVRTGFAIPPDVPIGPRPQGGS
jgi:hypothetical protein